MELPEEDFDFDALSVEDQLKHVIGGWLLEQQLQGTAPLVAVSNLLGVLYDTCLEAAGRLAVRAAFLMVYERSFEAPMTFVERQEAKVMLDQISNARRKVEGKPHLVLPGADDV